MQRLPCIAPRLPPAAFRSSLRMLHPLPAPLASRRITALALRGGAGVVGGVMAYVLFQVIQRMEWNQKRRIRGILSRPPPDLASFSPGPLFLPRSEKHEFITDVLNSDPGGPILVTGPQGSGKTMILKRALAQRPNTVYLSLRATPVTSGDALLVALVTNMGFLLPPNELLGRAIFNREAGPVPPAEIDRALSSITNVLREEKAWGWVRNAHDGSKVVLPPVICIDELNHSEVGSGLLEDAQFWRIVDWAMHLSDNRLAHIVFASALDVADLLDRYPGFRVRRQKVHFDFPRVGSVRDYYSRILNPFLRDVLGAVPRPQPAAAKAAAAPAAVVAMAALPPPQPAAAAPAPVPGSWWARVMRRTAPTPPAAAVVEEDAQAKSVATAAQPHHHASTDAHADAAAAGPVEAPAKDVARAAAAAAPAPAVIEHPPHTAAAPAPDASPSATPAPKPSAQLTEVSVGDTAFPIAAAKAAAAKAKATESSSAAATAAGANAAPPSTGVVATVVAAVSGEAHSTPVVTAPTPAAAPPAAAPAAPLMDDDDTIYLLEPTEIERLIDVIGGHLKDIDTVVSAITAGTHVALVLERLLADAAEQVERSLDDILASELRRDAVVNAAAGTRVKAMAKLLRARATVADHPLPPWNYSKMPSKDRLAAYARYLRAWTLISELGARKYIAKRELARRIFAEVPAELDFFLDVGLVISVNVKASTKLQHHRVNFNIESSVPGTYVTASSPRMRVAFRVLTADARLQLQTRRVQAALRAAALREEEHLLSARITEAVAERAYHAGQLGTLYTRDTAMRTTAAREWLAAAAAAAVSPVPPSDAAPLPPAARCSDVEDTPLTGMARLSSSLHSTQDAVRKCEEEIALLRKRLASTRSAAEEAEKAAVVYLPNTDISPALDTPAVEQKERESQAAEQKERDKVVDAMFEGEAGSPRAPATNEVFAYGLKAQQGDASSSPFLYGAGAGSAAGQAGATGGDTLSPWAPRPSTSGYRWWL